MPCKSVFLLQIKYIEKFKLLWQLKIDGGEGGKIILLCDERKQVGGGHSKTIFKKKLKEIKDQNKRVHKKLEGGCLWFNGKLSHRGGTGSH